MSILLRQTLMFNAVDALYLGFSTAYAFSRYDLVGALLFLAAQYLFSAAGYYGAFVLMCRSEARPWQVFRAGVAGLAAAMLLMAVAPADLWGLSILAVGGAGRGMAWGGRTWLELAHTKGAGREAYLAMLQSAVLLIRVVTPLFAAAALYLSAESYRVMFALAGALGLLGWVLLSPRATLSTPPPTAANPFRALVSRTYWETAPFYVLEGAGAALRQALFVSGTMAVVGSVSAYGVAEACASLVAAGVLAWLSTRPTPGPSLSRLKYSLLLVGVAWLLLLGALNVPVLLGGFVVLYAIGNPILVAVKASLVLKGLAMGGQAQDNAVARELMLVTSRLLALGLAAALVYAVRVPALGLSVVVGLMLALLPLEYWFAKRIAQAAK